MPQYATTITATSSGGAIAFTCNESTGVLLKAKSILVINDGTSTEIRFDFTSTSGLAAGAGHSVKAGESTSVTAPARAFYSGLSYSSSAISSVAVRILATR